jgi:polyisoprenoid-binding protein YceI
LCAAWPAGGAAQEYFVDLGAENVVRFISEARLHEFDGVTDRIDGFVRLGEAGLVAGATEGSEFYLEVDLGSLDTGVGLRDRQMRDNYLETDRFPYATFEGSFLHVARSDAEHVQVTGEGELTIHGVSRRQEITCDVTDVDDGFRAGCAFDLLLSDFDIEIPTVMFLKLANGIRLELDFWVRRAGEGEEGS